MGMLSIVNVDNGVVWCNGTGPLVCGGLLGGLAVNVNM